MSNNTCELKKIAYAIINKLDCDHCDFSKIELDSSLLKGLEKEFLKIEKEEQNQLDILGSAFNYARRIYSTKFQFDRKKIYDYGNCYVVKFWDELYKEITFIYSKNGELLKFYSYDDLENNCENLEEEVIKVTSQKNKVLTKRKEY